MRRSTQSTSPSNRSSSSSAARVSLSPTPKVVTPSSVTSSSSSISRTLPQQQDIENTMPSLPPGSSSPNRTTAGDRLHKEPTDHHDNDKLPISLQGVDFRRHQTSSPRSARKRSFPILLSTMSRRAYRFYLRHYRSIFLCVLPFFWIFQYWDMHKYTNAALRSAEPYLMQQVPSTNTVLGQQKSINSENDLQVIEPASRNVDTEGSNARVHGTDPSNVELGAFQGPGVDANAGGSPVSSPARVTTGASTMDDSGNNTQPKHDDTTKTSSHIDKSFVSAVLPVHLVENLLSRKSFPLVDVVYIRGQGRTRNEYRSEATSASNADSLRRTLDMENDEVINALMASSPIQLQKVVTYNHEYHRQTFALGPDGTLEQSTSVSVVNTSNHSDMATVPLPLVYLVDWKSLDRDCHVLDRVAMSLLGSIPPTGPRQKYFVYWDRSLSAKTITCSTTSPSSYIFRLFQETRLLSDSDNEIVVRCARQNMAVNRYWDERKEWVEVGSSVAEEDTRKNDSQLSGVGSMQIGTGSTILPLIHAPPFLRKAFVKQLLNVTDLWSYNGNTTAILRRLRKTDRKTNVAHFWRKGSALPYGYLRMRVSAILQELDQETKSLRLLIRVLGDDEAIETEAVTPEYVKQLLETKIVVIAQHDEWEGDNFRLLESMASGALVLSDVMVSPPYGLKNNTNIVYYHDAVSLKRLILYYLDPKNEGKRQKIASRGAAFALSQLGPNRIETLLFGKALSASPSVRAQDVSTK